MRTFEEVSKDLNTALVEVVAKREEQQVAHAKANTMIEEANYMKSVSNQNLNLAQEKAIELRKEINDLLNDLAPLNNESKVRQSR